MTADDSPERREHAGDDDDRGQRRERRMYLRFVAMIVTGMVAMYAVMYLGTYEWGHVRWSESRMFMALAMGGTMGLVMLGWMLGMYRNMRLNLAIVAGSVVLLAAGVALDRSQATVEVRSFMSGMIPHHSLAILRSERADIEDVRVCALAVRISEAQRREIAEMDWLIDDIMRNGPAITPAEGASRRVPPFEGRAERSCPTG